MTEDELFSGGQYVSRKRKWQDHSRYHFPESSAGRDLETILYTMKTPAMDNRITPMIMIRAPSYFPVRSKKIPRSGYWVSFLLVFCLMERLL